MPPKTTVWKLDDHTHGKHIVLKGYLHAWLPIVLMRYERAMFVDGFAGPGEYEKGEPGSPIIAVKALADHAHQRIMTGHMDYIFIEEDTKRFEHLREVVKREEMNVPSFCEMRTFNGKYDEIFPEIVDVLSSDGIIPTFVMIDPFGVSGVRMEQVKALMEYPSTEVYISFMFEAINRFASQPEFTEHLNELFGCTDWQEAPSKENPDGRRRFFHESYERQLRRAGAKFVIPFELYDGNRHVYTLFFATQNEQGCNKMKQAMWKAAPFGDFKFKGGMDRQFTLGSEIVDFSPLKVSLLSQFGLNKWVGIDSLEQFMRSDKTLFHDGHLRRTLTELEKEGKLAVKDGTRRTNRGYPKGTMLKFIEPPHLQVQETIQASFLASLEV